MKKNWLTIVVVSGMFPLLVGTSIIPGITENLEKKNESIQIEGQRSAFLSRTDWWSMFHHDLTHSGYSTSAAPSTNNILWTYPVGDYMYSSPAVVEGRMYFGSENSKMYCLDALSGAMIWSYVTGDRIWSSPAVTDGKVFFGSRDGNVYCLDAYNGSKLWAFPVPPWGPPSPQETYVDSSPAVVDGRVYIGANNRRVYCLNASSGDEIWSYLTGSWVFSSPAIVNNKVYVCSDDGYVYCFNALDGELVWSHEAPVFGPDSPTVVDGRVYVVPINSVLCLDAETGDELWRKTPQPWGELGTSSPGVANGKVYVGYWPPYELWGIIYCFNSVNGSTLWEINISGNALGSSSPAIADGKVYIGSIGSHPEYHGEVFCIDADTGQIVWNFTTGDWIMSSPAVVEGRLYMCSNDFTVYCFGNVSTNQPPTSPTINGPPSGKAKHQYNYTIVSTDPEGNNISYYVDWGDGKNTGWIGLYPSGEIVTKSHMWSKKGTYVIKAKAKDPYNTESDWGTFTITMPYSFNLPFMHFWMNLFERFPHAFPILRHLMGY